MSADDKLSEDWSRDGFVVVGELVGPEVVEELRVAYDDLVERRIEAVGDGMLGGITRQIMVPYLSDERFAENPAYRAGQRVAETLLGASADRLFDMLIYKPPGHPHETPWHQDMAYSQEPFAPAGTPVVDDAVQMWIPLDDVDEENGCMHFIPGAHGEPLLQHRVASGDPAESTRLLELIDTSAQVDLASAVAVPLRAGGATFHGNGTPHKTPANRSADRGRRAYITNFRRRQTNSESG